MISTNEGGDVHEEAVPAHPLTDPGAPTREEYEQHMLCHMPYRAWCVHCICGRAKRQPHPKLEAPSANSSPTVAMDPCRANKPVDEEERGGQETNSTPTLVLKCEKTGAVCMCIDVQNQ